MEHILTKYYESLEKYENISEISEDQSRNINIVFGLFEEFLEKYKISTTSIRDISLYDLLGFIVLCHDYIDKISDYLYLIENQNIFNSIKPLTIEVIEKDIKLLYKLFSEIDINSRTILKNG